MEETVRPLGVNAFSCEILRWPRSLFPGKHGRVFTAGPAPANPPKRDSVVKVLHTYSFQAGYNRNPRCPCLPKKELAIPPSLKKPWAIGVTEGQGLFEFVKSCILE